MAMLVTREGVNLRSAPKVMLATTGVGAPDL